MVFDFDGVLVDSNTIKYQSFFDTFPADVPGLRDVIGRIHAEGTYGDRFGLIRRVLESAGPALGVTSVDLEERVAWFADRYGRLTEDAVARCPAIPGAEETLTGLSSELPLYVNSATPQGPLRRIVERRGWTAYFRDVLGGPESKAHNLAAIIQREDIPPESVLFVGDGRRDLEASREIGCGFVGVRNRFNDFDTVGLRMINDLHALPDLLSQYQV